MSSFQIQLEKQNIEIKPISAIWRGGGSNPLSLVTVSSLVNVEILNANFLKSFLCKKVLKSHCTTKLGTPTP